MIQVFTQRGTLVTNITPVLTSISISGSLQEVARKLEGTIIYPIWDKAQTKVQIDPGTKIWAILDEKEIFRGMVIDRELSSNEQIAFTAFDYAIHLTKSKVTKNFKRITPENATKNICQELGVVTGSIVSTNIPVNRLLAQKTAYEAIMEMWTQASKQNGKQYYLYMEGIKVCMGLKGSKIATMILKPADNVLKNNGNVLNLSYKDSISEMINKVKIYDDKNNYIGVVQNAGDIKNYGIFQENYVKEEDKSYNTVAKNMLKGLTREVETEVLGNWEYKTGNAVEVKVPFVSTLQKAIMYIEADTHTWDIQSGTYITQLSLKYENIMDRRESNE